MAGELSLKTPATGLVTLSPANTATDKTITLPATTGTVVIQDGTNTTTVTNLSAASITDSGNLTFTGTGNRILGDFSALTLTNRAAFQTSTTNDSTFIQSLPNGTGPSSGFFAYNNSDPTNAGVASLSVNLSNVQLASGISGTGTYIPLAFLAGGSERMRITTTGRLGIGTGFPGSKLDVDGGSSTGGFTVGGSIASVRASSMVIDMGDSNRIMALGPDTTTAGTLKFIVASSNASVYTTAATINSSGNFGIGTSSPTAKLTVSSGEARLDLTATNASGRNWNLYSGGGGNVGAGAFAIAEGGATQRFVIIGGGGGESMRITSGGDVGIGTASPSARLETNVNTGNASQIRITNSSQSDQYLTLNMMGSTGFSVSGWDNSAVIEAVANTVGSGTRGLYLSAYNGPIIFSTTARSERMRIDSSGNLLVGSSADIFASGRVQVTTSSFGVNVSEIATDGGGAAFGANRTSSNGWVAGWYRAGAGVGSIAVTSTATTYNTTSDYRLKENVQPMTGALAKVSALKPCTYTWKADGSAGQGFIAHELQDVVPDAVFGEKDAVDEDGNPRYQGVDTSFLVATLTAAIQELTARLEVLENK